MAPAAIDGESVVFIGTDHPALAGHFPGQPIVPGVLLLDEALFAIGAARPLPPVSCRLAAVKFLYPVAPPATLTVRHTTGASGAIDFSVECAVDGLARTVASGRVAANAAPAAVGPAAPEPDR